MVARHHRTDILFTNLEKPQAKGQKSLVVAPDYCERNETWSGKILVCQRDNPVQGQVIDFVGIGSLPFHSRLRLQCHSVVELCDAQGIIGIIYSPVCCDPTMLQQDTANRVAKRTVLLLVYAALQPEAPVRSIRRASFVLNKGVSDRVAAGWWVAVIQRR